MHAKGREKRLTWFFWGVDVFLWGRYTEASDLWSLGIVIMMILTGVVPIGSGGHEAIRRAIALAAENPTKLTKSLKKKLEKSSLKLSKNCVDFVLKLLTVNVDHRMTAEQAAQHPWLTTGGEGGRGPNRRVQRLATPPLSHGWQSQRGALPQ